MKNYNFVTILSSKKACFNIKNGTKQTLSQHFVNFNGRSLSKYSENKQIFEKVSSEN